MPLDRSQGPGTGRPVAESPDYTLLICPVCGALTVREGAPPKTVPLCDGQAAAGVDLHEPALHDVESMVPVYLESYGGRRARALAAAAARTETSPTPAVDALEKIESLLEEAWDGWTWLKGERFAAVRDFRAQVLAAIAAGRGRHA